ncbi:MAG: hypothetical protein R2867_27145 [Caldilineaceae bacterium]
MDGPGCRRRAVGGLDALRWEPTARPILDDYFPQQVGFYTYNNGLYALPYYSGPSCIWYNEDIFREKGVKTPWEQARGDLDLGRRWRTRFTNHRQ